MPIVRMIAALAVLAADHPIAVMLDLVHTEWNGLKRPASPGSFSCGLQSCANPLMHPAVLG